MDENKKNLTGFQNVILENREKLSITGINDVFSFDDRIIIIETEARNINNKGRRFKD